MTDAARKVTVDWYAKDEYSIPSNLKEAMARYIVRGISGDNVAIANAFRITEGLKNIKHHTCLNTRNGKNQCVDNDHNSLSFIALLISIGYQSDDAAVI